MQDEPAQKPSTGRLLLTVFPSIMLPMFLAVVDQTIVATALPAIAASLGGVDRVSWVVVSYLVATTVAAPLYGQLRDVYGGRHMMFIALGIFLVASLLCTVATSMEMLAAARVLQGLGGGGLMTLSQSLIGETVPPRERARYQGYFASVLVSSSVFGPVVGGFLTHHFGWRSIFLVNIPLGLLAFALTARLPVRPGRVQSWTFDSVGLVLFVASIVPLLLALNVLQGMQTGTLPLVLALAAFGVCALVLLVRRERQASFPLFPASLLGQASVWRADALAACHGAAIVSLVAFLPLYLHAARGTSADEAGLLLLPLMFGIGTGSVTTGRIVNRTGYTTVFPTYGLALATVSIALVAVVGPALSRTGLGVLLFFTGMFMGTVMGVVQITVQTAAGAASLGSAAASVQLSRATGAAFGTAIVGSVLFGVLSFADSGSAGIFAAIIQQGPSALDALSPDRQAVVRGDIAMAFRAAFLTVSLFTATGAVLAWSIPARRIA